MGGVVAVLAAVELLVLWRPGDGVRNRFGADPELPDAADVRAGDTV